jgi:hypothetical protein
MPNKVSPGSTVCDFCCGKISRWPICKVKGGFNPLASITALAGTPNLRATPLKESPR